MAKVLTKTELLEIANNMKDDETLLVDVWDNLDIESSLECSLEDLYGDYSSQLPEICTELKRIIERQYDTEEGITNDIILHAFIDAKTNLNID